MERSVVETAMEFLDGVALGVREEEESEEESKDEEK